MLFEEGEAFFCIFENVFVEFRIGNRLLLPLHRAIKVANLGVGGRERVLERPGFPARGLTGFGGVLNRLLAVAELFDWASCQK